ncbi:hypothetical protein [Colwellia echini]|uniref:Uncharacterized protein n=1 Tax=Colwellia echini TaxID=1982103 RepID=A0ABY3MZ26_9GAMM|nr:hypothetical protein [Colwellia echini]TYK66481.1 hypothetical protein CWS31_005920 [Colwellia echini]
MGIDYKKYESYKKYIEDSEAYEVKKIIEWCKKNKYHEDEGVRFSANALIKYLTKAELPYSNLRAKNKRGQFKKVTELDLFIWAYARIHGVSKASREFQKNYHKIDETRNSIFTNKTIRDRIHKLAADNSIDYKTMMESNSFPHADLKNESLVYRPRGLLLLALTAYNDYLYKTTGYLRPKEQREKAKRDEKSNRLAQERQIEAIKSGVEPKKPYSTSEFFKQKLDWIKKAKKFDKEGK